MLDIQGLVASVVRFFMIDYFPMTAIFFSFDNNDLKYGCWIAYSAVIRLKGDN